MELKGQKSKRQLVRQILKKFVGTEVEMVKSKQRNEEFVIIPKKTKDETNQTLLEEKMNQTFYPVINTASDISHFHKICCDIKTGMDKIPDYIKTTKIWTLFYKTYVNPQSMKMT